MPDAVCDRIYLDLVACGSSEFDSARCAMWFPQWDTPVNFGAEVSSLEFFFL